MGPRHGCVRLTRTGIVALVCLVLGAGSHAAAGGGLPSLGVLLLGSLPVWLGAFALTGRRLGARGLAIALGGAQAGLHVFFHATAAAPVALAAGDTGQVGHAGYAGHLAHAGLAGVGQAATGAPAAAGMFGMSGVSGMELLAGLTPPMLLAHAVATAACALVLAYGEDLLWRVLRCLCRMPATAAPAAAAPLWRVHPAPAIAPGRHLVVTSPRRGPPLGSAC